MPKLKINRKPTHINPSMWRTAVLGCPLKPGSTNCSHRELRCLQLSYCTVKLTFVLCVSDVPPLVVPVPVTVTM